MLRYLPLLAVIGLMACGGEPNQDSPTEQPPASTNDVDYSSSEDLASDPNVVVFDNYRFTGTNIGGILDNSMWSGQTTSMKVRNYTTMTDFELLMEGENGAVMVWVTLARTIEDLIEPGQRYVLNNTDEDAFGSYAMTCSGNEAYSWNYDVSANTLIVETEEHELGTLVSVDIAAVYPDAGINDTMSGQFILERIE
ncbi:unnamed protein product [marine sediment metagenome]|uniref:Lipoprotein n=1 Tax=marine sediment metagenome TaxID=412755 RepID=X0URE6_9ZZZZ